MVRGKGPYLTAHIASLESKYPCPPSTEIGFVPAYGVVFKVRSVHFPKCHCLAMPHLNPDGVVFSSIDFFGD